MSSYIENYTLQFEYYKSLADKATNQVTEQQLFQVPGSNSNSIAIIMKHISGNQLSRWTDIFNTDGEKEWRHRDQEFMINEWNHKEVLTYWNKGWTVLFDTLRTLSDSDLEKVIYIRNIGHTVQEAIVRQLCHYSYHVGQIVFLARMMVGDDFTSLSIPKGKSTEYNSNKFGSPKEKGHFTDEFLNPSKD